MIENFLFIALPYIAFFLLIGGVIYRLFSGFMGSYRGKWDFTARGDFLWSTRSTGFFGRTSIGAASLNIHWGMILLLIAHVVGFIGGAYNLTALVDFFRWVGMFGGILFLYGLGLALWRRLTVPQLKAMSTFEDYAVLVLLIVVTVFGLYQSAVKLVFGVSYSVGPWLASLLTLQPDASYVRGIPLANKLHVIFALIFFAYFPFTKLVHAVTFPLNYLWRPYINLRRLEALKK